MYTLLYYWKKYECVFKPINVCIIDYIFFYYMNCFYRIDQPCNLKIKIESKIEILSTTEHDKQ